MWRDWVLVAAVFGSAALELALRDDIVGTGRWTAMALALALSLALLFRRTHPLIVTASVFAVLTTVNVASIVTNTPGFEMYTMAYVLVLSYSLFRWGSSREIALGGAVMLAALITGLLSDPAPVGEAIAGIVFFGLPAELGAVVRYWTRSRVREIEAVRTRERETLARELHDIVAHHVSAIAIRAQAGQAVAGRSPSAALNALEVIEREASATLAEMRTIVGVLRAEESADFIPQRGLADIRRLAGASGTGLVVEVHMGELGDLPTSVGSAAYRIAQEAVTNALRHSTGATEVAIEVSADHTSVHLRIENDGRTVSGRGYEGFGIQGMRERAELLGGTLLAGPRPGGGWVVDARLPRTIG